MVQQSWEKEVRNSRDATSVVAGKLKNLRHELKAWSMKLSNLKLLIDRCNKVIFFLDNLEECRHLYLPEWNLRMIIKRHLLTLLRYRNIYWRKRYIVNKIKFADECT